MDASDPEIEFDANGVCNHCKRAQALLEIRLPLYQTGAYRLDRIVDAMRSAGKGRKYDCVLGVSGGVDSTYAAYLLVQNGLRPLAVHFDNGWNSELAVKNIESVLRRLGVDLFTHVVDWEEFRDLQLAFLRASVPDAEIPTDHAIWALLYQTASRFGVRYVVSGTNLTAESILPRRWTYYVTDWKYIKGIHKAFGSRNLTTMPRAPLWRFLYWVIVRRLKTVSILNSVAYDKEQALSILERDLGFRRYAGKHHESIYTRFLQSYILPVKFQIDKRKAHLSALICSGQVTRAAALAELEEPIAPLKEIQDELKYVVKKLGITVEEFINIMALPRKSYKNYPNDAVLYEKLKAAMRWAQRYRLLPGQVGL